MSSSAINSQIAQLKIGNIQNQVDTSFVYNFGVWSFKNSTALTSVTITDAGRVGIGTSTPDSESKLHVSGGNVVATGGNFCAGVTRGYFWSGDNSFNGGIYGSDSGNKATLQSPQTIAFRTASNDRMIIDSSGNVGIGVTPSAWDNTFKNIQSGGSGYSGSLYSQANGDTSTGIVLNGYYNAGWKYTASGKAATQYEQNNGVHTWSSAASGTVNNAITWKGLGSISLNGAWTLGPSSGLIAGHIIQNAAAPQTYVLSCVKNTGADTLSNYYLLFTTNTTQQGYIWNDAAGNIGLGTLSDLNLKENIRPLEAGLVKVQQLNPVIYDWKSGSATNSMGFIAQEFEQVFPNAVGEVEGLKGISFGPEFYAVLVKAVQELSAKVEAQAEEIKALKAQP